MYFTNQNKIFEQKVVDKAIAHAQSCYPDECVGAIIEGKYHGFENKSPEPDKSFLLDDGAFKIAYMMGKVDAVIHSHCDCKPLATREDQISQQEMDIPFGVIQLQNKSVTHVIFWGDDLEVEPLLQRQFFYGVWDCYGLVRDWIRMNHKVLPPNPPRDWLFWHENVSMFEKYVQTGKLPYEFVDLRDIEVGDILLYNIDDSKFMNHCGILVESSKVLHHFDKSVSAYYPIGYYMKFLTLALRHNKNWEGYNDKSIWLSWKEIH